MVLFLGFLLCCVDIGQVEKMWKKKYIYIYIYVYYHRDHMAISRNWGVLLWGPYVRGPTVLMGVSGGVFFSGPYMRDPVRLGVPVWVFLSWALYCSWGLYWRPPNSGKTIFRARFKP